MFSEGQGRYIIATKDDGTDYSGRWLENHLTLGQAGGDRLKGLGIAVSLADLRAAHEGFFPALMGADGALA